MITYENNGQLALVTSIDVNNYTLSKYNSYNDFRNGQAPIESTVLNGPVNYSKIEETLPGWTRVCRNDQWQVVECGTLPAPQVPQSISARQIRLWLISNGISLSQIDTLINNIQDQTQREYTKVEWEYAPYVERNHPMVAIFASALNLSSEDVDNAFIEAVTM
jgi:hypothetical protein